MNKASAGTRTVVHSIRATEGELQFTVEIAGTEREIWVRSSLPVIAGPDVATAITLLPAMTQGGKLVIDAPVDARVLRRIPEIQAVFRSWQRRGDWPVAQAYRHEVELVCEAAAPAPRRNGRGAAAFFSGGVDSFATVLGNPEISHLIYVSGFDVRLEQREFDSRVRAMLAEAAAMLGKSLVTFETNLRELSDDFLPWVAYFGSALAGIARMAAPEFARIHLASSVDYDRLYENGAHPLLDHLWGDEGFELAHDGAHLKRIEKVKRISASEAARRTLRVCWQKPEAAYNCGHCEKCLRTAVALEVLKVRERFENFPNPPDPTEVAALRPRNRPEIDYWIENLELAIEHRADPDLIEAMHALLANAHHPARRAVDDAERERARIAWSSVREQRPMLHIHPRAWLELKTRRSVIFLVGSYDGSGNYGDIAQLQAALDLLDELGEDVAVLPVVDMRYLDSHRRGWLRATTNFDPRRVLVYASPGPDADFGVLKYGLVPFALPPTVDHAATYLYGGGYLNLRWASRMLTMVEGITVATEIAGIDRHDLISSGLQIEPVWARVIGERQRRIVRRLHPVGTRDALSARAALLLWGDDGGSALIDTGDDAVGVIASALQANGARTAAGKGSLRVNLHACPQAWVTDRPEALLTYLAEFIAGLARAANRPVALQPLVAYDDPRISELPVLEQLTAAAREPGVVEIAAKPIVLRPANLREGIATMRRAEVTVASSYHVALTSLLAGVPAVLLRDNDYYAQKAEGLRRDFSLPDEFFPSPRSDPHEAAARVLERLANPEGNGELAAALEHGRWQAIERRDSAEQAVLAALRSGQEYAFALPPRPRAVSEAEYEALLDSLGRALDHVGQVSALEAALEGVSRSVSWRLTAPLRAIKRLAGRERRR